MKSRRVLFWILLLVFVAGGVVLGVVTAKDVAEIREIETSIRDEQAALETVVKERDELAEAVRLEKERISEIPDSLSASRSAHVMRSSMSFAKQESILDRKEMRIEKKIKHLEKERGRVKDHLINWNVKLGIVEIVLLAVLIGFRRKLV